MVPKNNDRLLIISNSVLSLTRGNGKTIHSFFDNLPKESVRQLYFLKETPGIEGYSYFQITDEDVIKGFFVPSFRGRIIENAVNTDISDFVPRSPRVKTQLFRILRELVWHNKWKSKKLIKWLDEFNPTSIFFVAGDSVFAYSICEYICNRYNAKLSVFITDDYVLNRNKEGFLGYSRRTMVKRSMRTILDRADAFFTISEPMREEYKSLFKKDSELIVNIPDVRCPLQSNHNDYIKLVYAGNLYYGREDSLSELVKCLANYNELNMKKAYLYIYSTNPLNEYIKDKVVKNGVSFYGGYLNKEELQLELNSSDILVFVESFDNEQIEKTRLSLSTKVPEYLSLKKPILAIGPNNVGSMMYLEDAALCVNNINSLNSKLTSILSDLKLQEQLADKAYKKFLKNHQKDQVQKRLQDLVF